MLEFELRVDDTVFGGPRLPSEAMEYTEMLGAAERLEVVVEYPVDCVLSLFFELAMESRFFFASGSPSHLELTFGTVAGSFCGEMPLSPVGVVWRTRTISTISHVTKGKASLTAHSVRTEGALHYSIASQLHLSQVLPMHELELGCYCGLTYLASFLGLLLALLFSKLLESGLRRLF